MESDQALGMTVNGVDEVRRAVRAQVKGGVDWIKVSASGVAGSRFATAETEDLSADEIVAAVSEARKYGKPVHAHAHSREGVRACVEAGVLSLHSGEFVDEEILLMMREKGIIFSPTVAWLHARCLPGYVLAAESRFRRRSVAGLCGGQDIDRQGAGAGCENGDGLGRLAPLSSCAGRRTRT